MNTKSDYPVTDSITNVVEVGIVTAAVVSLVACEVTRHMGHALEGGVYKGAKSSWGLVKGAKDLLDYLSGTASGRKRLLRQSQKRLPSLL